MSRLTGDQSFEAAARRAVEALWKRRSPLGLVGGGVGGTTGRWASRPAGIGAGTDSFYEYLQKSAKLFGDEGMGEMFREAYAGVEEHLLWGGWHVEKDMYRGNKVREARRSMDRNHGGRTKQATRYEFSDLLGLDNTLGGLALNRTYLTYVSYI